MLTNKEMFLYALERLQVQAREELAKVADDFRTDEGFGKAEYRLRWLQGVAEVVHLANMAQTTELTIKQLGYERAVESARAAYRAQLDSWRPENSTSPFANASNNERYTALREFLKLLDRALEG